MPNILNSVHLDTDEGNAACINGRAYGALLKDTIC